MSNNLFRPPQNNTPTPFEQDIHDLVKTLKCKVTEIYNKNPPSSSMGMWIYGSHTSPESSQPENQEMLLFKTFTHEKIVKKYSHNLAENRRKKLTNELEQWIWDVQLVSKKGNLNKVLTEIESLKNKLCDFKDLKPSLYDPFKPPEKPVDDPFKPSETPTPFKQDIDHF
ncbi:MAG: hypothetical protein NWQ28_08575 [Nodularia sp. (in: cyanobacteria)]|nr:hypothetical protein [Nodularia sp. (in: cyanobacteria)]